MASAEEVWEKRFAQRPSPAAGPPRVPVIVVTDLYHPHQDVGDNFELVTAYALPELDLRAVVLDCTEPFRQPVAKDPGPGLFPDPNWPREPGFIPVLQLNRIFGRNVPCGTVPFTRMKSPEDRMLDAPVFEQQGVELILKTLRESKAPMHLVSFGSARGVAVAYNREPELFRKKLARLHLCAGGSSPPVELLPTDRVLTNELHACEISVRDADIYEFRETVRPSKAQVYYRGDPRENERALCEALPALYLSYRLQTAKKP